MRLGNLTLALVLLAAPACGGKGGAREARPTAVHPPDPGSGPYYCPTAGPSDTWVFTDYAGHQQRYSFLTLDDWEVGAGTGWYTNNSQCTYCDHLERACSGVSLADQSFGPDFVCSPPTGAAGAGGASAGTGGTATGGAAGAAESPEQAALDACRVSCLEIQTPPFTAKPVPADLIPDGGRCDSLFSLHILAGPFDTVPFAVNESWGGVIGRNFTPPLNVYAGGWQGIAFWGRAAPGSRKALKVSVTDPFTDPKAVPAHCSGTHSTDHPEVGCDSFGAVVVLDGNWRFFKVPFSEMRQGGWGRPAQYLNTAALYSISLGYDVGLWDFWIDDIYFYRLETAVN